MKYALFFIFFTAKVFSIHAQNNEDKFSEFFHIPASFTGSTATVSKYINTHTYTEKEKVQAIYAWVTSNIHYNPDSANALNMGGNEEAKVSVAFRRRKGVCENFAAIFNDIALQCGLTSFTVKGYTKQSGRVDKTGHTWCAAQIDSVWQLFDPTWDEGRYGQFSFFMLPATTFIETHMPYDPLWQFLYHPITHKQFSEGMMEYNKSDLFSYPDSLKRYLAMDSLSRLQSIARRMKREDLNTDLLRNNYSAVNMEIEMIRQDDDVDIYGNAVRNMNAASSILNKFISYRNNNFIPALPDLEVRNMLSGIHESLFKAINYINKLDESKAKFAIGTWKLREQVNTLQLHTAQQNEFLERYLNTDVTKRGALFYTSIPKSLR